MGAGQPAPGNPRGREGASAPRSPQQRRGRSPAACRSGDRDGARPAAGTELPERCRVTQLASHRHSGARRCSATAAAEGGGRGGRTRPRAPNGPLARPPLVHRPQAPPTARRRGRTGHGARSGTTAAGAAPPAPRLPVTPGEGPGHHRDPAPQPPPLERARQARLAARPLLTAALPNPCEGGAKPRPEAPGSQSTPAKGGDGAGCDHLLSFPRARPHEPEGSRRL